MDPVVKAYQEYMYSSHPQEAITDLDLWQAAWNACLDDIIKQREKNLMLEIIRDKIKTERIEK